MTLAYPVLDVLLLCLVGLAFGVSHWRPGRVWVFLRRSRAEALTDGLTGLGNRRRLMRDLDTSSRSGRTPRSTAGATGSTWGS